MPNDAVHPDSGEASNVGTMISCIDHHGGPAQNTVPKYESPKFETGVADHVEKEAAKANQSVGLSRTMEVERPRYRGTTAGVTAGKPQKHQTVPSALAESDGL